MEHAAEALKMAFAVILLVLALSLTIMIFTKAKNTADIVLSNADKFRYYEDYNAKIPTDSSGNRIVGMETVIPTVYKYDKERYKVTFKKGTYDESSGNITILGPLEIYTSETNQRNWNKNYTNDFDGKTKYDSGSVKKICSFDVVEEIQRNEPWTVNSEQIKLNLDAIFGGIEYKKLQDRQVINYSRNPLSKKGLKFIEQVGEVEIESTPEIADSVIGNKTTKKRIITYILLN